MGSLKRRAQVIPKNLYKVYSILFHKVVWAVMGIVDIASPISGIVYFVFFFLIPQAVDVVGQAGKPKTITGFQTHTTPVLLAHGERAELATEEFLPVTPILEGFVILRKNPNYDL